MKKILAATLFLSALTLHIQATTVFQTTSAAGGVDFNSATPWGTAPASGNDYVTTPGLVAGTVTAGYPTTTATLRGAIVANETFAGHSLTIAGNTLFLLKSAANDVLTVNNLTLNDQAFMDWANNASAYSCQLTGSMKIAAGNAYILNNNSGNAIFNISSTLTGSGTLNMGDDRSSETINLNGDLSGFAGNLTFMTVGNFKIGNASALTLGSTTLTFTTAGAGSAFTLQNDLTVAALNIKGTSIANGTYTGSQLDTLAGVTTFSGLGKTITVGAVPEPGTYALLLAGFGVLIGIKKFRRLA